MVFTGTDPEFSVEDYLNAVTANLTLNIGPEPINTPHHQNWIHRRTALIQTTLDGAAQKWFSVLPIDIKSDWKRFTQQFSKMFDSEKNKQHQRFLCNETRRQPNETIKQLAARIETLVRKAYSLNTQDYKNTKMRDFNDDSNTSIRKKSYQKEIITSLLNLRTRFWFWKSVDTLEQAKITIKLEETENPQLQFVNNIQTTTTQINNFHNSDIDLSEKINKILNINEKNPNFKVNHHSKIGVTIAEDTDIALLNADKNNKLTRINHKSIRKQTNHFINTWEKIKIYQIKTATVKQFWKTPSKQFKSIKKPITL